MFKRAVVCTDLTSSSDGIVSCGQQLGLLGVNEAVLVHVIELDRPGSGPGPGDDATFERQTLELERAGIAVRVDTAVGYAPYEIERIASENDASLIVAGSHGKGLFDGVMSGSVSSDLVRLAERPVLLTAPSPDNDPVQVGVSCAEMLSNVLFPSDLSGSCEHASRLLLDLAGTGKIKSVTLMHVITQDEKEHSAEDVHPKLRQLAESLMDAGVRTVDMVVTAGGPEHDVAAAAASGKYTLVVMGPHCSESTMDSLDSVTDATLQKTAAPVLLAPPGWRP